MYEILKLMPEVTEITAVTEAYVPLIKMEFDGIPVIILLIRLICCLRGWVIPPSQMTWI